MKKAAWFFLQAFEANGFQVAGQVFLPGHRPRP
jgi:hypothetical protein